MRRLRALLILTSVTVLVGPSIALADGPSSTHIDLLFRLGFAGKISLDVGAFDGKFDADTSLGVDFRVDIPVAKRVSLGPAISVYAARPRNSGIDRQPIVDIDPFLKLRRVTGRKKKIELYGLFQGGFSMVFLRKSLTTGDRFAPGWNIGITPGVRVILGRSFGLITEIGWMRTQGNFDTWDLIVNQGVWRIGFSF